MYGKLFESTFNGSMLGAGPVVFSVWSYIIAHAQDSMVEVNPVLAGVQIGCSPEEIEAALDWLQQPDPDSRSKEDEGRRIVKTGTFAYRVVNHKHYRTMRTPEDRREYMRRKQRESRARRKAAASQAASKPDVKESTQQKQRHKHKQIRPTGGEELEQLSLTSPDPKPPKKARKSSPNAEAWEIWRPLWTKRWSGSYPAGPADGAAMGRLWASATDSANDLQNGVTPGDVFRHWAESYLRDDGREGYLLRERHPLRSAHHSLARYGLPGEERAPDNDRPELERL
jgi:hypothetical protein